MQLNNACPDAPTIFLLLDMFPILPSKYFTENAPQAVVIWISSQWNILRSIHINTVNNQAPSRRDHWLSAIYKGLSMAWQAKSQSCWPCWDPEPRWQFFSHEVPGAWARVLPTELLSVFHSRKLCHGRRGQIWGHTDSLLKGSFLQFCDFEQVNTKSLMRNDGKSCGPWVWHGQLPSNTLFDKRHID